MGFVPQMLSIAQQGKSLIGLDVQEMTSIEVDQSNTDTTVIKQRISEVEVRYKQK